MPRRYDTAMEIFPSVPLAKSARASGDDLVRLSTGDDLQRRGVRALAVFDCVVWLPALLATT
jgi:hypothetical protein